MKTDKFLLEEVEFMPKKLEPGILYASQKYRTAAHLCACGCGEKVRTQLGPIGWHLSNRRSGPTLYPSIHPSAFGRSLAGPTATSRTGGSGDRATGRTQRSWKGGALSSRDATHTSKIIAEDMGSNSRIG